jgi:hypothetical protein
VEKKTIWIIGIILLIVGIVVDVIVYLIWGMNGLLKLLRTFFIIILIAGFIALAVYLVYYFFIKKHKFDVTAVNKKKLILAGTIQCPNTIRGRILRLSGDKGHSWLNFGKIKGYCRIQIMLRETKYDNKGNIEFKTDDFGNKSVEYELSAEEQDVFITKRGVFPFNVFNDDEVVRVHPLDHDELIGDVTLFGLNLCPLSEYWFLASHYLDVRKIDRAILLEAERGVLFEFMKDMKSIVDASVDLDSRHRKGIQEKVLYEIPQLQALQGNAQK